MKKNQRALHVAVVLFVGLIFVPLANAGNMTISCTPTCVSFGGALGVNSSNPVFSISNIGPTGLTGSSAGIAFLGVLLPEPTSLNSWIGTIGGVSTPSGTGIPGYTSGNIFSVFGKTGANIDFSTFDSLSTLAGASLTSYNVFGFNIGAFDTSGTVLGPFTNSNFSGATGFPTGTVFFAFLLEDTTSGFVVVNQSPLVVVTPLATATPEPSSILLFGTSLLSLVPFWHKLFGR